MGTQYKVSELMDNYLDNKFLIEQRQKADTDKILQGVKEKIKSKKRLRLGTRMLVAVVAAIAVIVTVTAISSPNAYFTSVLGSEYEFRWDGYASWTVSRLAPYDVEGDRVFFTADNQHIDITDLIKDNNVYFYEYRGTDSHGLEHLCYITVAGTIDDLGFSEIIFASDFSEIILDCYNSYEVYYLIDGKEINKRDLTEEQYEIRDDYESRCEDKVWWGILEDRVHEMYEEYGVSGYTEGRSVDNY